MHSFGPPFAIGLDPMYFQGWGKPGACRMRKFQKKVPLECHFCTILDLNLQLVWNQGISPISQEPAAGENFRKSAIFALFWTSIRNWSGTNEFSRVGKPVARRRRKIQKKVPLECHFCTILYLNLQLVWSQGIFKGGGIGIFKGGGIDFKGGGTVELCHLVSIVNITLRKISTK